MTPYDPERHGPNRIVGDGFHARVHALVRAVPSGAVTTYGDLAECLGLRTVARHVGFALSALAEGSDVPWHRVVDGRGRITRPGSPSAQRQRELLQQEGVQVEDSGAVRDFERLRHTFARQDPAAT